nr:hypothetical protein [Bacillota bacterium]
RNTGSKKQEEHLNSQRDNFKTQASDWKRSGVFLLGRWTGTLSHLSLPVPDLRIRSMLTPPRIIKNVVITTYIIEDLVDNDNKVFVWSLI